MTNPTLMLSVAISLLVAGCGAVAQPGVTDHRATWTVVPIPRAITAEARMEAFAEAADLLASSDKTISLMGNSVDEMFGVKGWKLALVRKHGLKVFPQLAIKRPAPLGAEAHIALARAVAERLQPSWMVVGVEVNAFLTDPAFVSRLDQIRAVVREVSPETKCCVSIQYEIARRDGNLERLVAAWPNADGVAFTTYPKAWLASAKLDDWYAPMQTAVGDKPLIISEAGWPAKDEAGERDQVRFLRALGDLGAEIVNYYYLFDTPVREHVQFQAMGLIAADGQKRPAAQEFQRLAR